MGESASGARHGKVLLGGGTVRLLACKVFPKPQTFGENCRGQTHLKDLNWECVISLHGAWEPVGFGVNSRTHLDRNGGLVMKLGGHILHYLGEIASVFAVNPDQTSGPPKKQAITGHPDWSTWFILEGFEQCSTVGLTWPKDENCPIYECWFSVRSSSDSPRVWSQVS